MQEFSDSLLAELSKHALHIFAFWATQSAGFFTHKGVTLAVFSKPETDTRHCQSLPLGSQDAGAAKHTLALVILDFVLLRAFAVE